MCRTWLVRLNNKCLKLHLCSQPKVEQRVQGLIGSVEQQVTEIVPVPSAGLVGKSTIQAKLAVNTVVQSIPAVVPRNTRLSHVTPESIIAAAGSGDVVHADGWDGADASNHTQQIAQDRDLAQAMQDWEDESDSMEEADDPPAHNARYMEPVAVGNNNEKNANGSYKRCSHGHPLNEPIDKRSNPEGTNAAVHYCNNLKAFKEIATSSVAVDESVLTCDCHVERRQAARDKVVEIYRKLVQ